MARRRCNSCFRRDAGQEFGVQGFPTIKFFRDGVASDYNGPRETEGIVT